MLSGPNQYCQGDAKIIVLSRWAGVDFPALPHFDLKLGQLVKAAPDLCVLREPN
jgi:hypothetical protein